MPLFPKSTSDWIRSLAYSLVASCFTVWLVVLWGGLGFTHNRVWHDAAPAIGGVLLPSLGVSLGLICLLGSGLDRGFRKFALVVAVLSVLLGIISLPVLAE